MIKHYPIRASSAPVHFYCPGSIRLEWQNRNRENMRFAVGQAAHTGTAAHEVIQQWIETGVTDIPAVIRKLPLDEPDQEELRFLLFGLVGLLEEIAEWIPSPQVEDHLELEWITGHPDLYQVSAGYALIWDHKTSRAENALYQAQMLAYSYMLSEIHPDLEEFYTYIGYARLGYADTPEKPYTREDVREFGLQLREKFERAKKASPPFVVGQHCGMCSHAVRCPAMKKVAVSFAGRKVTSTPLAFEKVFRQLPGIKKLIDEWETALKNYLEVVGPVQLSNGNKLDLVKSPRRRLDFGPGNHQRTMNAIRAHLEEDQLAGILSCSLADVKKVVMANAPNRGKGKAAKALVEDLEQKACFRITEAKSIKEVSSEK